MRTKRFSNPTEIDFDLMRQDRLASELDQEAVGDVIGVSPSIISAWESGKRTPKIHNLVAFAEIMKKQPTRYASGNATREIMVYVAKVNATKDFVGIN